MVLYRAPPLMLTTGSGQPWDNPGMTNLVEQQPAQSLLERAWLARFQIDFSVVRARLSVVPAGSVMCSTVTLSLSSRTVIFA